MENTSEEMGAEGEGEESPPLVKAHAFGTACRDCIFGEWEGNTQVGCEFGRLDAYEAQGVEVVGQDDGNRRYMVIPGRLCNACRDHDWGGRHPAIEWRDIVSREFTVRVDFIIYLDEESRGEAFEASLESVLGQRVVDPYGITVVVNQPDEDVSDYVRILRRNLARAGKNYPWLVRHIATEDDGSQPPYGRAIDIAVARLGKTTYYSVGKAGYRWAPDYLHVLNRCINYDMVQMIGMLPDAAGNGLCMYARVHDKMLRGHTTEQTVGDKLLEVTEEEGTRHLIKTMAELREECGIREGEVIA